MISFVDLGQWTFDLKCKRTSSDCCPIHGQDFLVKKQVYGFAKGTINRQRRFEKGTVKLVNYKISEHGGGEKTPDVNKKC